MDDRWDDDEARRFAAEHPDEPAGLPEVVYASRLLGADPELVLCGGGNTSVKSAGTGLAGDPIEVLHVKCSGWDLAGIEAAGFAPLRRDRLLALLELPSLTDSQMMHELRCACLVPGRADPSVEALLHALLPHRVVLHTHADAVLALTNLADGAERTAELYGDLIALVPYVMPGFDLAKYCAERLPSSMSDATSGVVLLNHGVFTFGDDARTAYRRMIDLVTRAERAVGWEGVAPYAPAGPPSAAEAREIAALRREVSHAAGRPLVLTRRQNVRAAVPTDRGPATPDHVIRTKRTPLVGRDVAAYAEAYTAYFARHAATARTAVTMLDPAPRVVLDPELGLLAAGPSARDADAAADIYRHTLAIIERGEALGGYRPITEADLFALEYWELEQAKLKRSGAAPELAGQVALVTGAASGIGRACAEALLGRGASVVGVDVTPEVDGVSHAPAYLGVRADVTDAAAVDEAVRRAAERFGGLDVLVASAGIFGPSAALAAGDPAVWRSVMDVNLDSLTHLFRSAHPLLALAPTYGRVVLIGSKNVAAPGPGAGAYSASKAAATQLARVAALEWGADGIRVNVVHPDAVFDTGLWSEDVLAARAARYGLTVDQYKHRNLLATEIESATVARAVAALCTPAFAATTGAQIPVDGGNDRVI